MYAHYPTLAPHYFVLRDAKNDEERLKRLVFHLKTDDYFASIATIMGFLKETIQECSQTGTPMRDVQIRTLDDLRKDLLYLHANYHIMPKKG